MVGGHTALSNAKPRHGCWRVRKLKLQLNFQNQSTQAVEFLNNP